MPPITPRWSWMGVICPLDHAMSMTSHSSQSRIGWRTYRSFENRTRSRWRSASRATFSQRRLGVSRSGWSEASRMTSWTVSAKVTSGDSNAAAGTLRAPIFGPGARAIVPAA